VFLQERFYRYGIRPEWLQIHHVISKQTLRDGTNQYFIKWRDLPYVDCSWEDEDEEIPDFQVSWKKMTKALIFLYKHITMYNNYVIIHNSIAMFSL
jgi:hypothetical protein